MSLIIGCDPGVAGAIAFLTTEGKLLAVEDIPVDRTQVGKHARSKVSIPRLLSLLRGAEDARFFVEEPEFRPMMKRNALFCSSARGQECREARTSHLPW